jgi:uncharacterized protein YbjT (DUF2867 family)
MDKRGDNIVAAIAGASGLVGSELLKILLSQDAVSGVHALVRRPLPATNSKLIHHQHDSLVITEWDDTVSSPDIGFICLGTTLKQAGSKDALARVDYELVCDVAREMKLIGVKRIAVVSSFGADPHSLSHYLRCKGKMEKVILDMGFERVVFMRPGPLAGKRDQVRKDELYIGRILRLIDPLLIGYLANFRPIAATDVARAMLYALLQPQRKPGDNYMTFSSVQIINMIQRYQY